MRIKDSPDPALVVYGTACYPDPPQRRRVSWYRLVKQDSAPPSSFYLRLHQLKKSKGQTVAFVCRKYHFENGKEDLKVLLIIAEKQQLDIATSVKYPFDVVIIPRFYKKELNGYLKNDAYYEATTKFIDHLSMLLLFVVSLYVYVFCSCSYIERSE